VPTVACIPVLRSWNSGAEGVDQMSKAVYMLVAWALCIPVLPGSVYVPSWVALLCLSCKLPSKMMVLGSVTAHACKTGVHKDAYRACLVAHIPTHQHTKIRL
jgi:hypothetical protein